VRKPARRSRSASISELHDSIGQRYGRFRQPDPRIRATISSFTQLPGAELEAGLTRLRSDLAAGAWQRRNDALREREQLDLGYRLVVAEIA
jgi:hypothetical protein